MKKSLLIVLFILFSIFSVYAERGLRIGHGVILDNRDPNLGLTVLSGVDIGLSKRFELNIQAMAKLVPTLFSDIKAGFEVGYSFMGDRIRYDSYSGSAINAIISLGVFASNDKETNAFVPTYLTLRITPVTLGTVLSAKRESFLPIGVAWNFRNNSFSLFLGAVVYDHYIKGTWRDIKHGEK